MNYLGNELLRLQVVSDHDLEKALIYQQQLGGRLTSILVRIGAVSEERLLHGLAEIAGLPVFRATEIRRSVESFLRLVEISGLDMEWWLDQELYCWQEEDKDAIYCAAKDLVDDSVEEILTDVFSPSTISFGLLATNELERLLESADRSGQQSFSAEGDVQRLKELAEEAPVIEFVNNLLAQGFDQNASDVHIEPQEHNFEVRYRIDGVLYTKFTLGKDRYGAASSRIKLISGMDISERRLPQDGRLSMRLSGEDVEIRVSSIPGVHGESIVMRLLPKERKGFSLESLGFEQDHLDHFRNWVKQPHGILLVTGPTGSGKSTTLYSTLEAINNRSQKIITVEDPVEYRIPGITQIQVHSDIGYTFAGALRSILRQDPDIIMIGEIRDLETAEIAVQASLTGHLVLSTLHTNDAAGAFTRLIDMGVEPFLVASPVRGVLAQRLVRKLCPHCAVAEAPAQHIRLLGQNLAEKYLDGSAPTWKKAVGCEHCRGTGYNARLGIYELIPVTTEIQQRIMEKCSPGEIRELAEKMGLRTMRDDGILKAWQGITTIDEVFRVT